MTGTRLSTESLKINHIVAGSFARYQDVNPSIIVPVTRKKFQNIGKIVRQFATVRYKIHKHEED